VSPRDYPATRADVIIGALVADVIAFFIIVCTASTLYTQGVSITSAEEAAVALEPIAGTLARYLFGIGLLNASLLGASILPLSTSYTICEAFGWEEGVDRSWREAPAFHGLYAFAIVFGASVALLPGLPLFAVMVFAQDVNGVLLIVVLTFAIKLASDRNIMGAYASGRFGKTVAWTTAAGLIMLTALLIATSVAHVLGISLV
jgi:Mn2+/Fe2+ NRAMP family transporter